MKKCTSIGRINYLNNIKQFVKFGIVGGTNTIISLLIYYLMVYWGISYLPATITGYFSSSIIGYILSRLWVFRAYTSKLFSSTIRYYIVYISSLLINVTTMYLWVDLIGLSKYIAPVLTLIITVPYNFVLSKFWVFKEKTI